MKRYRNILFTILIGIPVQNCLAIPVFDIRGLLEAAEQSKQLKKQYEIFQMQLQSQKELQSQLTGNYNIGNLLSNKEFYDAFFAGPNGPILSENLFDGSEAYKKRFIKLREIHTPSKDFIGGLSGRQYAQHQSYKDRHANQAAMAASQYEKLNEERRRILSLMEEIDKTKNLKAAIDLSNRLQAENLLMQVNFLGLQSTQMQATSLDSLDIANATEKTLEFIRR